MGSNMAQVGSQRAAAAAEAAGKAAVYQLEKDLAQLESSMVLEPYTGEDLKEILKAAEVLHAPYNNSITRCVPKTCAQEVQEQNGFCR